MSAYRVKELRFKEIKKFDLSNQEKPRFGLTSITTSVALSYVIVVHTVQQAINVYV